MLEFLKKNKKHEPNPNSFCLNAYGITVKVQLISRRPFYDTLWSVIVNSQELSEQAEIVRDEEEAAEKLAGMVLMWYQKTNELSKVKDELDMRNKIYYD